MTKDATGLFLTILIVLVACEPKFVGETARKVVDAYKATPAMKDDTP
jgi:hypothetical protein